MRIRHKPWAKPELTACGYYYRDGSENRGRWQEVFGDNKPIYAELGCGKGGFIAEAALLYPDVNWIACDIKDEMLAFARRKTERNFQENSREVTGLILLTLNIEKTELAFAPGEIDRIYINFCPPWKRERDYKHRLTHPRQLIKYREILKTGGEILFKTDDDILFEDSLLYFEECNFKTVQIERDLHSAGFSDNIITEHEKMFAEAGKKIKYIRVIKT
ncbi:MAG: tRNA (guanosine(46)-N7)-methyltransferase TrmB [Ruminococcus sp.]|jgi:tRNA (guanine-N7-)-methyltransferase|nr:tRNA (guanosine(46)-N7)-methyltransferase TrmB [Ruminococcus sp.]